MSADEETYLSDEDAQAAKDKLERAIKDYYLAVQPDVFVDDWVLVAHKDSIELAAEGQSMVGYLTPTGQAFHRTAGLLACAARESVQF